MTVEDVDLYCPVCNKRIKASKNWQAQGMAQNEAVTDACESLISHLMTSSRHNLNEPDATRAALAAAQTTYASWEPPRWGQAVPAATQLPPPPPPAAPPPAPELAVAQQPPPPPAAVPASREPEPELVEDAAVADFRKGVRGRQRPGQLRSMPGDASWRNGHGGRQRPGQLRSLRRPGRTARTTTGSTLASLKVLGR